MRRLFAIVLAALMMYAMAMTAVCVLQEGWGDEEEIIWKEREGLQDVGDVNGSFYRYVGTVEKYYYYLYSDIEARVEDGTLHIYGADGEELFLCDEFDLDKQPWIQEIIDAYDGEVEIPMHHVDIVGIFIPAEEYEGSVTVVAPQEGLSVAEAAEAVITELPN